MKVILYDDASTDVKNLLARSINLLREKNGVNTFQELDEHFEAEYACTILYTRDRGITGFCWKNDADYTWFTLKVSG